MKWYPRARAVDHLIGEPVGVPVRHCGGYGLVASGVRIADRDVVVQRRLGHSRRGWSDGRGGDASGDAGQKELGKRPRSDSTGSTHHLCRVNTASLLLLLPMVVLEYVPE